MLTREIQTIRALLLLRLERYGCNGGLVRRDKTVSQNLQNRTKRLLPAAMLAPSDGLRD